jgi:hypothetical protein
MRQPWPIAADRLEEVCPTFGTPPSDCCFQERQVYPNLAECRSAFYYGFGITALQEKCSPPLEISLIGAKLSSKSREGVNKTL